MRHPGEEGAQIAGSGRGLWNLEDGSRRDLGVWRREERVTLAALAAYLLFNMFALYKYGGAAA